MRGNAALGSEVAGGGHQRSSEVPAPGPVDEHSCGQGRGGGGDRASQFQATGTSAKGAWSVVSAEHLQESARRDRAGGGDVAPQEDGQVAVLTDPEVHPGEVGITGIDEHGGVVDGVSGRGVQEGGQFQRRHLRLHRLDLLGSRRRGGVLLESNGDLEPPDAVLGPDHPPFLLGGQLDQRPLHLPVAGEHSGERVVVFLREGIKLVSMTPRTGDGQPEQASAESVDAFVPVVAGDRFDHRFRQAGVLVIGGRGAEVSEGTEVGSLEVGQQVGGQLHDQELVVGQVGVDGLDDPVPVPPGVGVRSIGGLAGRVVFGPPRDIEPVTPPAFSIVPALEQPIDEPDGGIGSPIRLELCDLLLCRRQSEQVELESSQQCAACGRWRGFQAM